jgi:hypothetical protein
MTAASLSWRGRLMLGLALAAALVSSALAQTPANQPVKVTITEDKNEISEKSLPLDPAVRIQYQFVGAMSFGVMSDGKNLTCGPGAANTIFKIDGQLVAADGNIQPQPLPTIPNKKRTGMQAAWTRGDIKITMILEVVPGKPYAKDAAAQQKRRMDTLLIKHVIENNGAKAHDVGARTFIDTMCGNNDGAIFASPTTHPGKLLDGIALKGKEVPEFIEMLEVPNLHNPGFKGIFTFKTANKVEGPSRIALTGLGLGVQGDGWEVGVGTANGDSAVAFYWDPQQIAPKGKREIAFALGQGIACNPENEGKVAIHFGGNFEPGKEFTVTAYVEDPLEGQSLTLELPAGMERTAGKETQSVPLTKDGSLGIVIWKASVKELGNYNVRIRSSNGITSMRTVSIEKR